MRMALGAQKGEVVGSVVRSGVVLAGTGIVMGGVAAALSTRFMESLLFEVSALAAWIPAARAGSLPPAEVLRSE